jgi:hypothetical protein
MADDKGKDKGKPKEASGGRALFHKDHHKEVLYFVLPGLLILSVLVARILAWIDGLQFGLLGTLWEKIIYLFLRFWHIWVPLAIILSIASIAWGIYSFLKIREIEHEEKLIFGTHSSTTSPEGAPAPLKVDNERWLKVEEYANSYNPAEWRLAIIEAGVMLEEALKAGGYHGDSVGEMLKSVDPSDMLTLDAAWEAHKVRNRIAHSGQDFDLTERETRRVIALFESVFREFRLI